MTSISSGSESSGSSECVSHWLRETEAAELLTELDSALMLEQVDRASDDNSDTDSVVLTERQQTFSLLWDAASTGLLTGNDTEMLLVEIERADQYATMSDETSSSDPRKLLYSERSNLILRYVQEECEEKLSEVQFDLDTFVETHSRPADDRTNDVSLDRELARATNKRQAIDVLSFDASDDTASLREAYMLTLISLFALVALVATVSS
ncbi:unnamed protein product [Somion occarium]|uniref:Uncharacterized protein n=1 Tax=Somion occarium TaxID=3059160 RepID=A0ABP1CUU4_9APHY